MSGRKGANREAGEDSQGYSHSDYNDGIPILVHMFNRVDMEVVFNPPLEDMDALYLEAHMVENCSNPVVRMIIQPNGVANMNQSIVGYGVYNYGPGAPIGPQINPATALPFQQMYSSSTTDPGMITSDYPSFSQGGPIILYTGLVANQGAWFQYQHPPLVSKDFSGGKLQKMRVTVDTVFSQGTGVTADKLILAFRGYHKKPKYQDPYHATGPDARKGWSRSTSSALTHKF